MLASRGTPDSVQSLAFFRIPATPWVVGRSRVKHEGARILDDSFKRSESRRLKRVLVGALAADARTKTYALTLGARL